ncbi:MAG TPA: protein kinase [Candidatus Eisenbacteria bacterium]|nr:protein kinase [Candidatus Eisenbacteria bacterium]
MELDHRLNTGLKGHYAIQHELGRGGTATVFLAQDLRHRRPVAIKVLHPELAAIIGPQRFLREIEVAAGLTHPHILPLYDSGETDGLLYYVMPYAEGESLRQRLEREKQLPIDDAMRITRETADALDHAHRRGVVHRDIKPENILLLGQHAVVADFGIARALIAAGDERLTATGAAIGTPAYMSPEQTAGSRDVDGRSDQYSLGCVAYEMLAGVPPFSGPTMESLAHQHLSVAPRPVTDLRPAVAVATSAAITRALAKTAADRFGTLTEFATALDAGREAATGGIGPIRASQTPLELQDTVLMRPSRRRRFALAGAAVVVAVAAVAWVLMRSEPRPTAEKHWILVADFDGPADDSSLAATARDLVCATLDQSRFVATVPSEQMRLALARAERPVNTPVDAQLARELAYRSSVRTVLAGSIGRLGRGYSVVLRVEDAETPRTILTERATARNEDALIPALQRIAERLRAGLGERQKEIRESRPRDPVATASFEAYQLYVRGRGLGKELRSREAIAVLRDALALDPDFAMAWRSLAINLQLLGQSDSALAALDQALRRPHRLTTTERLMIEANRATMAGELELAIQAFGRALQHDPSNALALQNRHVVWCMMGRFPEALEDLHAYYRADPFGLYDLNRRNEARVLSSLGRSDEARKVARAIERPAYRHDALIGVEIAATRWAAVESLAIIRLREPDPGPVAVFALASAQAARGAWRAAASTFERVERDSSEVEGTGIQHSRRGRLMLSVVSGGAIPLPAHPWAGDSSAADILTRGLRAALAGNRMDAQRLFALAQKRPRLEQVRQGATPSLLAARLEALVNRWNEVVTILQPVARQPVEFGYCTDPAGMSAIRWLLADAFEQLGRPDSAAACLERITSDPAPFLHDYYLRGVIIPLAHRRLVLLYARMGRIDDARRHWQLFSETVRTPDPEVESLIAEARDALRNAEAATRSARL